MLGVAQSQIGHARSTTPSSVALTSALHSPRAARSLDKRWSVPLYPGPDRGSLAWPILVPAKLAYQADLPSSVYPDAAALKAVDAPQKLIRRLVFAGEARNLKARSPRWPGKAFLLQGGDCAESFAEFHANNIRDTFYICWRAGTGWSYLDQYLHFSLEFHSQIFSQAEGARAAGKRDSQ